MKRHSIVLLIQPYKNGLIPKVQLEESINRFADRLIALCSKHTHLRYNIILPAYILEHIDPLKLPQLRELFNKNIIEWLLTGYTEPFVSFSPDWLTSENIRHGISVFNQLTGSNPAGYCPPFSNWEPSHIDILSCTGIKYSVISKGVLAKDTQNSCGYWITEHTGNSMAIFPATVFCSCDAPARPINWIEKELKNRECKTDLPGVVILKYLLPLNGDTETDPYAWLETISSGLNRKILHYHPVRIQDILANNAPLGLQYLPASLAPSKDQPANIFFRNYLHSHDQFGILQRKLTEACQEVKSLEDRKQKSKITKKLFMVQDINRYLPSETAGFTCIEDRLWTYGELIGIEEEIQCHKGNNGQIRLMDFLRNGYKSIILSNKHIKAYLDHKKGGHIFALDYLDRAYNVCATYNPHVRTQPDILDPRGTHFSFMDHIYTDLTAADGNDQYHLDKPDCGNFSASPFEYTFKKTSSGAKIVLSRQGSFVNNEKQFPLSMEKVFGLEGEKSVLTFAYQLSNPSMANYSFVFAIRISLALPGVTSGNSRLIYRNEFQTIGAQPMQINNINSWVIQDKSAGTALHFSTPKKTTILLSPSCSSETPNEPTLSNGITLSIVNPVTIDVSSLWSFMGKITFRKARFKGQSDDLI